MSSDNKDWKGEVAIEVYKDGLQPTVKQVGDTIGKVFGALLAPLNVLAERGKALIDRLRPRIEGIPGGRLQLPSGPIAGPTMFHYAMLDDGGDTAELREMFENLLLSSMDSETAKNAHPAFVAMVSQMTQEEAWILKTIGPDRVDFAACTVNMPEDDGSVTNLGLHTLLGVEVVPDDSKRLQCISNLDRLGILRITSETATNHGEHDTLKKHLDSRYERDTWSVAGSIEVTPLGRRFLDTCVRTLRARH